eukprot:9015101-Alexandrium_andersonii.AAC.1
MGAGAYDLRSKQATPGSEHIASEAGKCRPRGRDADLGGQVFGLRRGSMRKVDQKSRRSGGGHQTLQRWLDV